MLQEAKVSGEGDGGEFYFQTDCQGRMETERKRTRCSCVREEDEEEEERGDKAGHKLDGG